ncbi:MAG: CRISPR-associated endonuclease Cas2 [Desulfuromonadales bacterium]|nr:CRISPR-associated endonuclease Cas2 [Desulfuromonadales bacterium]
MWLIVTYDVNTEDRAGQKRLRRVAKVCKAYGQRVQKSVFECSVNEMQYEQMKRELVKEIDKACDSLRIYRLIGSRDCVIDSFGVDGFINFEETLIV